MTPQASLYRFSKYINTQRPLVKVAMLVGIWLVLVAVGQATLWTLKLQDPLAVDNQIHQVGLENAQLEQIIAQLQRQINANSLDQAIAQRLALQLELSEVKEALQASTQYLIPPKQMPTILRNLLQKHRKLELIEFLTAPPKLIATHEDALPVYRHGIRIQVRGSYNDMTAWLNEIEQLPWVLNWNRLGYRMDTYPNGLLTLELHTLSREEAWLDI